MTTRPEDFRKTPRKMRIPIKRGRSTMNGVTVDHAMLRWDSIGRDHPGITARPSDTLVKYDSVLQKALNDSSDARLANLRRLEMISVKVRASTATTTTTTPASGSYPTTS